MPDIRYYTIDPRQKRRRQSILRVFLLLLLSGTVLLAISQLQVVREFFGQAGGLPANLIVDNRVVLGSMPRPWRNLAQGGEDHDWRLGPLTGQVASLHPQYIRLDHIYDFYDIVQGQPGNLTFNWSKFDLVIDDILAAGAKPYISLSYMPPAISSGDILAPPQNWSDWQLVVQKTIEHLSGSRGIADVYYEVWNEPDLFGGYKYYGDKNYLNLYRYASAGAQRASSSVRPFKLGGPAITALYKSWFDAWAKACVDNQWRCDFFSWHRYSTDLDQYAKDMAEAESWLQQYPALEPTLELHITEWGFDSENHAGYDSAYGAAHTVAAAIAMMNRVEMAFTFEIQDGKDPNGQANWGRWGLFTHNDFGANAKARFRALKLLDSIPDQRLSIVGNGSWVKALAARDNDGSIKLIMANFDPKGQHSETVPLTLQHVEAGNYQLDVEYLSGRRMSNVLSVENDTLITQIVLGVNEVAKVTVRKI